MRISDWSSDVCSSDLVRVTTRFSETGFVSGVMGVIPETGHALYERGLPAEWRGLPIGAARGLVLPESQSLLMEMPACRSPAFLGFLSTKAKAAFGGDGAAWDPANPNGRTHVCTPVPHSHLV